MSGAFASDSSSFSTRVTSLEDFSSSLDATYATEAELVAATASLSASLTTTDQAISSSVATLSGSASTSRNAIVASISGAFSIPDGTVSSSAQTIANLPAGTVSGSVQVSDITGSSIITGSVQGNTLTFTKGDLTTFDLLVITSSGGGGATDTGSLLITSSISASGELVMTKGDGSQYSESIVAVSASKVDPISALSDLQHFVDDSAAGIGGIPKGGLYRNGNFVLIRIGDILFADTHYLTGWSNTNFTDFGLPLTNFLTEGNPWSFGFRLSAAIVTNGEEFTNFSTDNGAHALELDNASTWYSYLYSDTDDGTFNAITTEPTQTIPSYWLMSYDGTTMTTYYNGTQIDTSTEDTALNATTSGNVAFGKSIEAFREPWNTSAGAGAFYFSDQALASSINTTAFNNNGDITSDAEYSKVNGFINVGNGTLIDLKSTFSPTVQGTLTFTAK